MTNFEWGGTPKGLIDRDWTTGDPIWCVGDFVEDPKRPGGLLIVQDIVARRRIVLETGQSVCRFTYAISSV